MAHVGKEIKRMREERGLNQAQLAVSIGTGPAAISRIENGRQSPNTETLERIARALGVEMGDLFPKGQAPLPLESEERRPRVFDMVYELVSRQLEEDRQAIARSRESGFAQGSFVRHENEAMNRLLEYPPGDVAEAYVDLMRAYLEGELQLQPESDRASATGAREVQVRNQ